MHLVLEWMMYVKKNFSLNRTSFTMRNCVMNYEDNLRLMTRCPLNESHNTANINSADYNKTQIPNQTVDQSSNGNIILTPINVPEIKSDQQCIDKEFELLQPHLNTGYLKYDGEFPTPNNNRKRSRDNYDDDDIESPVKKRKMDHNITKNGKGNDDSKDEVIIQHKDQKSYLTIYLCCYIQSVNK